MRRLPGEIYRDMVSKIVRWHGQDVLDVIDRRGCAFSMLCEKIESQHMDLLDEVGIVDNAEAWIQQLAEDAYAAIWRETRFTNAPDRYAMQTKVF